MGHGMKAERTFERGVSLLELIVYIAVLSLLGTPLVMVVLSVTRSSAEGAMFTGILERNRSILHRMASDYRNSIRGTTAVSSDGKSVQFTTHGGFDGTGPVPGPVISYEIRLSPKESLNDIDDDGNGLIDEGLLLRVDKASGQEVVLLAGLHAGKSHFLENAGGVDIALTTVGRTHHSKHIASVERSVTVFPRS